jgi:hypothetical protein
MTLEVKRFTRKNRGFCAMYREVKKRFVRLLRGGLYCGAMTVATLWVPKNEEDKEQVRQQMMRLLETPHFRNSRRYPALFRFIVEETLGGRGEFLKERLLGVRVFNRPPDYDTANDPIVRVTIAEIRKRIAQYYHEEAHESEMRIELLPGRYEPEFHPRRLRSADAGESQDSHTMSRHTGSGFRDFDRAPAPVAGAPPLDTKLKRSGLSLLARWGIGGAAIVLLAMSSVMLWQSMHPAATDEFWKPVLAAHRSVILCIPSGAAGSNVAAAAGILSSSASSALERPPASNEDGAANGASFLDHETEDENVVFSDVLAMQKISNWLATREMETGVSLNSHTTLDDLQQGPAVLIGGLDNNWTLRELAHMRYRFSGTDQEQYWIVDSTNPEKRDWEVDLNSKYPAVKRDYALIARFHDDSTRQVEVIVAGIGMTGTAAAGKFLVDPNQVKELRRRVGPGFKDHDFEAVLGMDVVNGMAGSPRILAISVW